MPVKFEHSARRQAALLRLARGQLRQELVSAARDVAALQEREVQRRYRAGTGRAFGRLGTATLARGIGRLASSVRSRSQVRGLRAESRTYVPPSGPLYARVHEDGAVIRGRPYLRFRTRDGRWHTVRQVIIPRRPVWAATRLTMRKPTLRRYRIAVDRWTERFNRFR